MVMERDSIPRMNAEGRARRMSYGQYVAAAYYPVVIVEILPDGGKIQRTAALPEPVAAVEPVGQMAQNRKPAKKPVSVKPGRKCAICGSELGRYQRKYCSDDCARKAAKAQYAAKERKPYVSTAKREDRPCAVCGKLMIQVAGKKKYCSADCKQAGTRELQKAYRAQYDEPKARYCQICGVRIEGNRWKYCDNCAGAEEVLERRREYHREYKRKQARTEAVQAWENEEDVHK